MQDWPTPVVKWQQAPTTTHIRRMEKRQNSAVRVQILLIFLLDDNTPEDEVKSRKQHGWEGGPNLRAWLLMIMACHHIQANQWLCAQIHCRFTQW